MDPLDPLGLREGEMVSVVPTDSGTRNPQVGRLFGLNTEIVGIMVDVPGHSEGKIRVWFPRRNYKITKAMKSEGRARI